MSVECDATTAAKRLKYIEQRLRVAETGDHSLQSAEFEPEDSECPNDELMVVGCFMDTVINSDKFDVEEKAKAAMYEFNIWQFAPLFNGCIRKYEILDRFDDIALLESARKEYERLNDTKHIWGYQDTCDMINRRLTEQPQEAIACQERLAALSNV